MTDFETQVLIELQAIRKCLEHIAGKNTSCTPTSEKISIPNNTSDKGESITPKAVEKIQSLYFGTPDGDGFEESNMIADGNNPKVLYVVETSDGINGRFYPLNRGLPRLRSNASSFLLPMCDIRSSIESIDTSNLSPENYGVIILEDGYWKVKSKCII